MEVSIMLKEKIQCNNLFTAFATVPIHTITVHNRTFTVPDNKIIFDIKALVYMAQRLDPGSNIIVYEKTFHLFPDRSLLCHTGKSAVRL